jgi:arylsulfatase A-like enzyme
MKVIFLNLHGCRLDALGTYGGTQATTPHFDRLAAESVVFDQHFVNWLHLERTPGDAHLRILEPFLISDLVTSLRDRGIVTVLVGDERTLPSWPVLSGWKELRFVQEEDLPLMEQPTLSDGVLQSAIDWLQVYGPAREDWFLWIESGALLPPWRQNEYQAMIETGVRASQDEAQDPGTVDPVFEYAELETEEALPERFGWKTAYTGVMRYLDDLLGQFLTLLKELNLEESCLLAVSSPAGQPLGERSAVPERLLGAYEERAHLPLILRLPGKEGAGRRVSQLTQAADWLATVAGLFGVNFQSQVPAQDLLPLVRGVSGRLRDYALSLVRQDGDEPWEASLRTLDWHGITPLHASNRRPGQLYRKPEDRWDTNNVIREHSDVAEHLELTVRRLLAWLGEGQPGEPPALREEVLRILRT